MRGIKLIKTGLASLLVAVGAFVAVAALDPSGQANAAKCSTNDVIDCGVTSMAELRDRYNSDYTKGTKAIFGHFGITSDMVNKGTYKQGTLYRDGRVVVDGKTVATGAHTVGRNYQPGSDRHTSGGYTFYSGPADVRFVRDVRPVFVFFDEHGRYSRAVMMDCGNPVVKAKPSAPKPSYECKTLSAAKVSRTKFNFTTTVATSGGATPVSYAYDFGDGTTQTSNSATISHDYSEPGTYTAKVTVTFRANGVNQPATDKVTCLVKITVEEEPEPEPKYIEVCRLEDKQYPVRIKEEDFDETLHSMDPNDCKEEPKPKYIEVCRLEDKKYPVRIKEDDFDATLHSKDPNDCKEKVVVKDEVVELPPTGLSTLR